MLKISTLSKLICTFYATLIRILMSPPHSTLYLPWKLGRLILKFNWKNIFERIAKKFLEKNNEAGLTLVDMKLYCKTILKSCGSISKYHNLPKGTLAPWKKGLIVNLGQEM